jgi:4'-phosphopantetheinyl transferase
MKTDEIAVWLCRVDSLTDADRAAMDALLSREEQARRDRFVFAEDRRAFAAAHALLRTALSRHGAAPPGDWRLETTAHGKPFLPPPQAGHPPLHFNLSHTRAAAVCAVATGADLGVDIQECAPAVDGGQVADRFFTAAERQMLASCPVAEREVRFAELWALKEAYVKGVGLGLRLPLDSFAFSFEDAPALTFQGPGDPGSWRFWLASVSPTVRIALAASAAPPNGPRRVSWWGHDGAPASGVTLLRWSAE